MKQVCPGCQSTDNSFAPHSLCSLCRGMKHFQSAGYWHSSSTNIIGYFRCKLILKQLSGQACKIKVLTGVTMKAPVFITTLQLKTFKDTSTTFSMQFPWDNCKHLNLHCWFSSSSFNFFCDCKGQGVGYLSLQKAIFRPPFIFSFLHTRLI